MLTPLEGFDDATVSVRVVAPAKQGKGLRGPKEGLGATGRDGQTQVGRPPRRLHQGVEIAEKGLGDRDPLDFPLQAEHVLGPENGLDPGKRAALIQLGSGNMNDVSSMGEVTAERLLGVPDLEVALGTAAGGPGAIHGRTLALASLYAAAYSAACLYAASLLVTWRRAGLVTK